MNLQERLAERVEKYMALEEEALKKIRISVPQGSHLMTVAEDFLEMIRNYKNDASHFISQGDLVNALSALNYSYGWIDAGVRFGLFDGFGDTRLFTVFRSD